MMPVNQSQEVGRGKCLAALQKLENPLQLPEEIGLHTMQIRKKSPIISNFP